MHLSAFILADETESLIKLVIFGVIAIIWLIGRIAKFFAGTAQKPQPIQQSTSPAQRPAPATQRRQSAPKAAGAIPLPPLAKMQAQPGRRVKRPSPTAAVAPASTPRPLDELLEAGAPAVVSVSPSRLHGSTWLDARTVREQFIMAEAMKPPVSLR